MTGEIVEVLQFRPKLLSLR